MDEWFVVTFTDIKGHLTKRVAVQGRDQVGEIIAKEFPEIDAFDKVEMRDFLERNPQCKFPSRWERITIHAKGCYSKATVVFITEQPRFKNG